MNESFFLLGKSRYNDTFMSEIDFHSHNRLRNYHTVGAGYRLDRLDTSVQLGVKEVLQSNRYSDFKESFPTITSETKVSIPIKDFKLNLQNTFTMDYFKSDFYMLPWYSDILDISLTVYEKNDNYVTLGTRISLLSEVLTIASDLVHTNACFDIYATIGITKMFDISASFNNIGRRSYFGNDVLSDLNFTSYMTWYFLN
jgi:hypothetical protein